MFLQTLSHPCFSFFMSWKQEASCHSVHKRRKRKRKEIFQFNFLSYSRQILFLVDLFFENLLKNIIPEEPKPIIHKIFDCSCSQEKGEDDRRHQDWQGKQMMGEIVLFEKNTCTTIFFNKLKRGRKEERCVKNQNGWCFVRRGLGLWTPMPCYSSNFFCIPASFKSEVSLPLTLTLEGAVSGNSSLWFWTTSSRERKREREIKGNKFKVEDWREVRVIAI